MPRNYTPYLWRNASPTEIWPGDYEAMQAYDPFAMDIVDADLDAELVAISASGARTSFDVAQAEIDDGLPF